MNIRKLTKTHWTAVKEIFIEGINTQNATFTTLQEVSGWDQWSSKHLEHSRFVAIENEKILGWAALTPYSTKYEYRGVAEVSVYVSEKARGKKIGTLLLKKLITTSEENDIWTLQSRIYPENKASLKIHYNEDFYNVGMMKRVGRINGMWRNVLIVERRSEKVGI